MSMLLLFHLGFKVCDLRLLEEDVVLLKLDLFILSFCFGIQTLCFLSYGADLVIQRCLDIKILNMSSTLITALVESSIVLRQSEHMLCARPTHSLSTSPAMGPTIVFDDRDLAEGRAAELAVL